jgi:CRISPR-associated protein Cmr6
MIHNTCNLGWHYYRNYFIQNGTTAIDISSKDALKADRTEDVFKVRNKEITDYKPAQLFELQKLDNAIAFKLYTTYPGLLLGAGNEHEISAKGEIKLGLFFDYTTGLPIVSGSSLKGVLRSAFPQWVNHKKTDAEIKWTKTYYIKSLLTNVAIEVIEEEYANDEVKKAELQKEITAIENAIFEGIKNNDAKTSNEKFYSIYERDIFLDAYIYAAGKGDQIVGIDSITPHIQEGKPYEEAMLKNPTPLPFLKVLPNVGLQFNIMLTNNGLDKDTKKRLFIAILTTIGIGAKTNVGYGQLATNKLKIGDEVEVLNEEQSNINDYLIAPSAKAIRLMQNNTQWNGKIIFNKKENYIIQIEVGGELVNLKKKADKIKGEKTLVKDAEILVKFTAAYAVNNPSFDATII